MTRVRMWRRMRSIEACGKGKLPKCTDSHGPEAGSDAEQAQNCHIGNYMEGYLTQERYKVSTAASKPSVLPVFDFTAVWPSPPRTYKIQEKV